MKSIKTDRCNLRPFTLADIKPSYRINLDPDVTRYTNDGGVKTLPQMRETIANNVLSDYEKYGFGRFAVEDQATGNFIGFSGLKFIEDEDFLILDIDSIKIIGVRVLQLKPQSHHCNLGLTI